jgi:hypothetical protein
MSGMRFGRRRARPAQSVLDELAARTAENRRRRKGALDERLVQLRHEAFPELDPTPLAAWPRPFADPFPEIEGRPPEISPAELTVPVLGGAIQHHGCLLVRGLFSAARVATLVDDTERAFRARVDAEAGAPVKATTPWYAPFEPGAGWPALPDAQRKWVRCST